jgi:hypothetical protein
MDLNAQAGFKIQENSFIEQFGKSTALGFDKLAKATISLRKLF